MNNFIIGLCQFFYGLLLLCVVIAGAVIGQRVLGENGGLFGAAAALLGCAVLFGPLFILIRIDENIKDIRDDVNDMLQRKQATTPRR